MYTDWNRVAECERRIAQLKNALAPFGGLADEMDAVAREANTDPDNVAVHVNYADASKAREALTVPDDSSVFVEYNKLRDEEGAKWAASRWEHEVAHRPIQNVHRRALDTTWRQVIRYFGADPDALCGPCHDVLASQACTCSPQDVHDYGPCGENCGSMQR